MYVRMGSFRELALVDLPRTVVVLVLVTGTAAPDCSDDAWSVVDIGFEFAAHVRCVAYSVGFGQLLAHVAYIAFVGLAGDVDALGRAVVVVADDIAVAAAAAAAAATDAVAMNVAAAAVAWPFHVSEAVTAQQGEPQDALLLWALPPTTLCLHLDLHLLADLQ